MRIVPGAHCVEIMQEIVRGAQARRDSLVLPSRRRKINIIAVIKGRIIDIW